MLVSSAECTISLDRFLVSVILCIASFKLKKTTFLKAAQKDL